MRFKDKYILPAILISLVVTVGFLLSSMYRGLNEAGMKSCIFSLEAPIADSFRNNSSEFNISLGSEWKTLGLEESGALLNRLVKARRTDCGTMKGIQEGKDCWGNSIRIALRQSPAGEKVEVKVWSNGEDGEENTGDDIRVESIR